MLFLRDFGHLVPFWDPVACATGLACKKCQHLGACTLRLLVQESLCIVSSLNLLRWGGHQRPLWAMLTGRRWHCCHISRLLCLQNATQGRPALWDTCEVLH